MDIFKLRLKIGVNEFEAEGSQEYVQAERQVFLDNIDEHHEEPDEEPAPPPGDNPGVPPPPPGAKSAISLADMAKLAHQDKSDKDLIVLTALPQEAETQKQDALLLLLLAHRVIRNEENVKSTDALNGMKQSGIGVSEIASVAEKMSTLVLKTGVRKGTKYRLSTSGVQRAVEVAKTLLAHVG
ncbi:MAG: hypothetical protein WAJ99_17380 [Candidatus Sulfotelmatobacter sp.]